MWLADYSASVAAEDFTHSIFLCETFKLMHPFNVQSNDLAKSFSRTLLQPPRATCWLLLEAYRDGQPRIAEADSPTKNREADQHEISDWPRSFRFDRVKQLAQRAYCFWIEPQVKVDDTG